MRETITIARNVKTGEWDVLHPFGANVTEQKQKNKELFNNGGKVVIPAKGKRPKREIQYDRIEQLDSHRPYYSRKIKGLKQD